MLEKNIGMKHQFFSAKPGLSVGIYEEKELITFGKHEIFTGLFVLQLIHQLSLSNLVLKKLPENTKLQTSNKTQ